MTARSSLLLLLGLGACTPKVQEEYKIEIVGDLSTRFLEGATRAVLEVNDKQVATTPITADTAFSLRGTGVDVKTMTSATFRIKAVNDAGVVIAQGQSPEIELDLASPPVVRIFIQKPGSFGRTFDLDYPRRDMIAVPVLASVGTNSRAKAITVALLGLGNVTVPAAEGNALIEKPSEVLQIFNPVTQIMDAAGVGGAPSGSPHPRVNASATVHSDNRALIFGGEVTVGTMPPAPSAQLDSIRVLRTQFDEFGRNLTFRESMMPGVARVSPALVFTDATYAIGGRGLVMVGTELQPATLDTIVQINPDIDDGFRVLQQKLAGPRHRHTATVVSLGSGREALIFGGAGAAVPVAEVLIAGGVLVPVTGNAGPPRIDHAAVVLPPGDRALVIGGRTGGTIVGDTVLYQAGNRTVAPGSITLKRPRAEFSAFVVGDDLVVAGGIGADGNLIDTAEIYGATDLQPKALDVPCVARTGAAVVVLPHRFVLLMGGTEAVPGKRAFWQASAAVETYQPLAKP
jgi:hypothetical protein